MKLREDDSKEYEVYDMFNEPFSERMFLASSPDGPGCRLHYKKIDVGSFIVVSLHDGISSREVIGKIDRFLLRNTEEFGHHDAEDEGDADFDWDPRHNESHNWTAHYIMFSLLPRLTNDAVVASQDLLTHLPLIRCKYESEVGELGVDTKYICHVTSVKAILRTMKWDDHSFVVVKRMNLFS